MPGQSHEVVYLDPNEIAPWPGLNPRRRFVEEAVEELADSIREHGVLQPIVVHDRGDVPEGEPTHHIVAGETRWRATLRAGLDRIPAVVRTFTEAEALRVALLENMHRNQLTVIEEARGFQRLLELDPDLRQETLAGDIKRSQAYVSNRLRLLRLPDAALELIEDGIVDPSTARDYLVPFAQIPEKKRAQLYAAIAKEIRKEAERARKHAADLRSQDVRRIVAQVAVRHSRPIYDGEMAWGVDEERPLFDPKLHKKCTCQGPRFNYRDWGTDHARCFDEQWWQAAQQEAREAEQAEVQAAAAELDAGAATQVRILTERQFRSKYGYGHQPLNSDHVDRILDASQLVDAPLVVVEEPGGERVVYCVDEKAVKRAKSAVTRERNQMVTERKAERGREDLARVADMPIEPWMLAELLIVRPATDTMMFVGRELGFDMGKHGDVDDAIRRLPEDQLEALVKVLALRSKEKRLSYWVYSNPDPIETEVDGILKRKYGPGMRALAKRAIAAAGKVEKEAAA